MQYILNTGGYNFPKPQLNLAMSRLLGGEGISYAQGYTPSIRTPRLVC